MEGRAALPGRGAAGLDRDRAPLPARFAGRPLPSAPRCSTDLRGSRRRRAIRRRSCRDAGARRRCGGGSSTRRRLAIVDAATPVLALLVRRVGRAALWPMDLPGRAGARDDRRHAPAEPAVHLARPRVACWPRTARRLFPWIAAAEVTARRRAAVSALHLGADADITAAPLLIVALVLVASLAIIEPATTLRCRAAARNVM